jgi:heme/copper-type cytochrome/quinol oxidase subunit 4
MRDRVEWRWIPDTRRQSLISIGVGVLLAVVNVWTMLRTSVRVPALEVVVIVLAVVMIVTGIVGLTRHNARQNHARQD